MCVICNNHKETILHFFNKDYWLINFVILLTKIYVYWCPKWLHVKYVPFTERNKDF